MLSSLIQKLSSAKPFALLPPKPPLASHAKTSSFSSTYKQQKNFSRKHTSLSIRSCLLDNKAISAVTHKSSGVVAVKATVTAKGLFIPSATESLYDEITDIEVTGIGKSLLLELASADLDEKTGEEKDAIQHYARLLGSSKPGALKFVANFDIPAGFGEVGAVLIQNEYHKELFIESIVLEGLPAAPVTLSCKSWVCSKDDNPAKRIFFTEKSYLPSDTPSGLRRYREEELEQLRGNGHREERQPFERIYDYDTYNDLGDPDTNPVLARPVLGTKQYPYPRRCRTGRPRTKTGPLSESRTDVIYVPRDEAFSLLKEANFRINTIKSLLHALIPNIKAALCDENRFPYFTAIDELFNEGVELPNDNDVMTRDLHNVLPRSVKLYKNGKKILRFETPELFERDKFVWFRDEEFSRQTLAGMNPFGIQLVKEWPLKSELDPKIYGPAESAITKEIIEKEIRGFMTLEEALDQKKLFMLDYHDLLLPYVAKVRELEGTTLYGSRTLFCLIDESRLMPVCIELTRPKIGDKPQWKEVFTPNHDATGCWLWRLAKAHVLAHDSGIHQLVSHWLRTHACVEPYVIASHRQLSEMHPIYRLLHPHFRYTMEINALARGKLINADGIIESTFSPGKYSFELSSAAYDKLWRFDTEALPADLIKRGMAEKDKTAEHGLKLAIRDYPFANDGLMLWDAIKQWVSDCVKHYYPEASKVESDTELQAFWEEVRTKGHGDKKNEPWWPVLKTQDDLIQTLTTIIWVTSGHHAAVNFGQYGYGGYFPNRPTIARTNMPTEKSSEEELELFMKRPEIALLQCFPSPQQATQIMATLDVLSAHSPDEEYIGNTFEPSWEAEPVIKVAYERFNAKLKELEATIDERNYDLKNTNRVGAGVVPYELLKPLSEKGVTGKGVPNSISI